MGKQIQTKLLQYNIVNVGIELFKDYCGNPSRDRDLIQYMQDGGDEAWLPQRNNAFSDQAENIHGRKYSRQSYNMCTKGRGGSVHVLCCAKSLQLCLTL